MTVWPYTSFLKKKKKAKAVKTESPGKLEKPNKGRKKITQVKI